MVHRLKRLHTNCVNLLRLNSSNTRRIKTSNIIIYHFVIHLHNTFSVLLKSPLPAIVLAAIPTQYCSLGSKSLITSCEFSELVVKMVFVSWSTSGHLALSVGLYATEYTVGNPLLSSNISCVQVTWISVALILFMLVIAGTSGTVGWMVGVERHWWVPVVYLDCYSECKLASFPGPACSSLAVRNSRRISYCKQQTCRAWERG